MIGKPLLTCSEVVKLENVRFPVDEKSFDNSFVYFSRFETWKDKEYVDIIWNWLVYLIVNSIEPVQCTVYNVHYTGSLLTVNIQNKCNMDSIFRTNVCNKYNLEI